MPTETAKPPGGAVPDPDVGHGAASYSKVLKSAGGEQLKALMRNGDDPAVCAVLYAAPPYDLRVPAMAVSRLSLNLTPSRVFGGADGESARSYDAHRYSLFMAPAGTEMVWRKEATSRHVTMFFRPDLFDQADGPSSPLSRCEPFHNLEVPGLRPLAEQLADEIRRDGDHSVEAADSLARLMLIQVSRHLGKARDEARALGPASMARLNDHVMAHLGERVLVADMARQVGLSPDHFAWAFKSETGQSPHQFVVARRLEQARHLLGSTRMPIAEVAQVCGFASQQHLTNAMRRHDGITPARCRQALQPGAAPDAPA